MPILELSVEWISLGLSLEIHNLGRFFLGIATALEYFLLRPRAGFPLTVSMSK